MAYQTDTISRLRELHSWFTELVRSMSDFASRTVNNDPLSIVNPVPGQADFIAEPIDAGTMGVHPDYSGYARATESMRTIVANFESVLAQIDPLEPRETGSLRWDGVEAWDQAFAELKEDILEHADSPPATRLLSVPSDRYAARLNYVLISAGIPTVGGADADTIVSGDGCWRDMGGSAYWKVVGSVKGGYMPLFSNVPYYSCRKIAEGGVFSTHEFALKLNVKCPENLQYGDRVRLVISESGRGATYQPGDELVLPIVAAAPVYLTGGRSGNPIQTWNVNGSVDGPLAAYTFNPESPTPYSVPGLGFTLSEGGIPWEQGDRFRFAVEGGHYRWRKNGGAWQEESPPQPIPITSELIDEGLSISFTSGAAASFVDGDVYRFRALQPWAVSNTQTPSSAVWKWDGSSATYEADFGAIEQMDFIAIVHGLPAGAVVTLEGNAGILLAEDGTPLLNEDGQEILTDEYTWSEVLTYRVGVIKQALDRAARYVRLTITDAPDGWIQWPWIGEPVATSLSGEFQLRREWNMNRPGGSLQGGRFKGKTLSGDVSWTEAALKESDVTDLAALLDHVKENDDEPIIFVPQITRTEEPVLFARIDSDQVDFPDPMAYNQNVQHERRVSASIPLSGVWQ